MHYQSNLTGNTLFIYQIIATMQNQLAAKSLITVMLFQIANKWKLFSDIKKATNKN